MKKTKRKEQNTEMDNFVFSSIEAVRLMREQLNATVILVSAYEHNSNATDDELRYLSEIKQVFGSDDMVVLIDYPLTLQEYVHEISKMTLLLGTRLHTTLTALKLGIPAININYTLKGRDIYSDLGLTEHVIELKDFINKPDIILEKINTIIVHYKDITHKIAQANEKAYKHNLETYKQVFKTT